MKIKQLPTAPNNKPTTNPNFYFFEGQKSQLLTVELLIHVPEKNPTTTTPRSEDGFYQSSSMRYFKQALKWEVEKEAPMSPS